MNIGDTAFGADEVMGESLVDTLSVRIYDFRVSQNDVLEKSNRKSFNQPKATVDVTAYRRVSPDYAKGRPVPQVWRHEASYSGAD